MLIDGLKIALQSHIFILKNGMTFLLYLGPIIALETAILSIIGVTVGNGSAPWFTIFVSSIFTAFAALFWHRFVLLNSKSFLRAAGTKDSQAQAFIGISLLIVGLVAFASLVVTPFAAFGLLPSIFSALSFLPPPPIPHLSLVLVISMVTILLPRVALALPPTAVGNENLGIRETWGMTKGRTFQTALPVYLSLAGAYLAKVTILQMLANSAGSVFSVIPLGFAVPVIPFVESIFATLASAITATTLSTIYLSLIDGAHPSEFALPDDTP